MIHAEPRQPKLESPCSRGQEREETAAVAVAASVSGAPKYLRIEQRRIEIVDLMTSAR